MCEYAIYVQGEPLLPSHMCNLNEANELRSSQIHNSAAPKKPAGWIPCCAFDFYCVPLAFSCKNHSLPQHWSCVLRAKSKSPWSCFRAVPSLIPAALTISSKWPDHCESAEPPRLRGLQPSSIHCKGRQKRSVESCCRPAIISLSVRLVDKVDPLRVTM